MKCIVHYIYEDEEYSELKPVSENQYKRIIKAKTIRAKSTGPNQHLQKFTSFCIARECPTVPEKGINKSVHGVHLEPCCKIYRIIPESSKRKSIFAKQTPKGPLKRIRIEKGASSSVIFPKVCFVCKKLRHTVKKKTSTAHVITTTSAAKKIKRAAELKEDDETLVQIKDADLLAKELTCHNQCYLDYIRCLTASPAPANIFGDFEGVKKSIEEGILKCNKAVSMTTLHKIYGVGFGNVNEINLRTK